MLVIGIDPGTATTGYGLIRETVSGVEAVDYGVITTSAQSPMDERLLSLYQQLNDSYFSINPIVVRWRSCFLAAM